MKTNEYITKIRRDLENDSIPKAISKLKRLLENSTMLTASLQESARHRSLVKQIAIGTVSIPEAIQKKDEIRLELFDILREVESQRNRPEITYELEVVIRDFLEEDQKQARQAMKRLAFGILLAIAVVSGAISFWFRDRIWRTPRSLTCLVHGEKGIDQCVLPNRGIVTLNYGDNFVAKQLNSQCEVTFKQLPANFFESNAKVRIFFQDPLGEEYHAVALDSLYDLGESDLIDLEVKLYGLELVHGTILDSTDVPLKGIMVRASGESTITNEFGEFALHFPKEKQKRFQTIRLFRDGVLIRQFTNKPITPDGLPLKL